MHAPPLEILYDGIVYRQEFTANARHLTNPDGVPYQAITLLDVKQSEDITREKWDYGAGPFCGLGAVFEGYLAGTERVRILLSSLKNAGPRLVLPASSVAFDPKHAS